MARVEVSIRFLYQDTLYADTTGYIPRHEAIKIAELKVQENQTRAVSTQKPQIPIKETANKSNKGKKQSDMEQQNLDEIEDMDNQLEDVENELQNEMDQMEEEEPQPELEENQNEQNQFQEEDDEEDQLEDDDNELSEMSRSFSGNANYLKYKTKRQKGQLDNFLQLPLKKPRKDAKKYDEATQLIRKQQKQRKRRQYIKKLMEAQQKATFDKILNETGRKFRQRQQKQMKQQNLKDKRVYKTLGNIPKIITKQNKQGLTIYLHNTQLFPAQLCYEPNIRMSENCSICKLAVGKYKTKLGQRFCSTNCFKVIQNNQSIKSGQKVKA